jgi:hypothetical protein
LLELEALGEFNLDGLGDLDLSFEWCDIELEGLPVAAKPAK